MRKTLFYRKRKVFLGFLAGSAFSLSLSPFDFWIVALVSPAILYLLTRDGSVAEAVFFLLFHSRHFSLRSALDFFFQLMITAMPQFFLSGGLVLLFVILYSFMILPGGFIYARFYRSSDNLAMLAFISVWVTSEWIRSWFLTGFPWLYLGYGAMGSWLENFSPFLGVFGVSFCLSIYFSKFIEII